LSIHNITILATTQFTSSALIFMNELRSYQGTQGIVSGINEWTGSNVNYLHVDKWYFNGSFSQSSDPGGRTATHSHPQTVGYEVICGQGRNYETVKYEKTFNPSGTYSGEAYNNLITSSIKTARGVPNTHTISTQPPGPPPSSG
tara:strand:- start:72 stop:503 length:432 start_codon:yes stop_codon:yes gene_type:complete